MRVNIVVKDGWILGRCARELTAIPGVVVNATGYLPRRPSAEEATYFMPMKDIRHMPGVAGIKIGFFTHGEQRSALFVDQFDVCVCMNQALAAHVEKLGGRCVTVIRPGTEPPPRPIRFGVCGRIYGKTRKGAWLVKEALAAGFEVVGCSDITEGRKAPPCRITHSIEDRAAFYASIDYLLVPSIEEGGPMPVVEAIAHGVPVIAPDVGWCWEFPVLRYERGSWDSLRDVLEKLTQPPTWPGWVSGHELLFSLLEKRAA